MLRGWRPNSLLLAAMLACGLLLAELPLVPTTAPDESVVIYSLDICHPAQAISAASTHCSLLAPAAPISFARNEIVHSVEVSVRPVQMLAAVPPDTPPPENFLQH